MLSSAVRLKKSKLSFANRWARSGELHPTKPSNWTVFRSWAHPDRTRWAILMFDATAEQIVPHLRDSRSQNGSTKREHLIDFHLYRQCPLLRSWNQPNNLTEQRNRSNAAAQQDPLAILLMCQSEPTPPAGHCDTVRQTEENFQNKTIMFYYIDFPVSR